MRIIYALCLRNIRAFLRDKTRAVFTLLFPLLFVFVFREIFSNEFIDNPVTFILAGIVMVTVFDFALRISSSTIDDIVSGFMKEVLVSPAPRISIAIGQFLSSALISMIQGLIILGVGFFIGLRVTTPFTIVYALLAMVAIGLVFAGFGLFLAVTSKSTQTFQVITMTITTPMTFISGAYIPLSFLPQWLVNVSYFNPLTYAVALFRAIILEQTNYSQFDLINKGLAFEIGSFTITPFISLIILVAFGLLFMVLSTMKFLRLDFSRINRNKGDEIKM